MKRFQLLWLIALNAVASAFAQTGAPTVDAGDATLRNWVQPDYPGEAKKNKNEGEVVVEFVVEVDGHVSGAVAKKSSNAVFENAAVSAVSQWTFNPALEDGKPIASGMVVRVPFSPRYQNQKPAPVTPPAQEFMPMPLPLTPAKAKFVPDPDYPEELDERKIPGEVEIEFTVNGDGKATAPKVALATHAAFVEVALHALEKAQFEPARQGAATKASVMIYPMAFESMGAKRADVFAANGISVVSDPVPDTLPGVIVLIEPIYPFSKLVAGESGSAEVEFEVDEKGFVTTTHLATSSAPEFGAALLAAVEAWIFKPAIQSGNNQAVKLKVAHAFSPPKEGPVARLVPDLQPNGAGIGGATGLDRKLKPLWRGFPAYPHALREEGPAGEAKIEFIIDRFGRARAPRVISATREEFGWAAATAISQWVFEPPMKKGEPADVKVVIPVGFKPPKG